MKVCRGFTLIELMVTIAVLAILATVGIPGFVDLVQNNRVTTQANELVTALNVGRTEAVKRGRPVQVVVAQAAPGWTATVSVVGDAGPALRVVDRTGSMITVNRRDGGLPGHRRAPVGRDLRHGAVDQL
jgi:type IV fimbrial biogenesis protein FimT